MDEDSMRNVTRRFHANAVAIRKSLGQRQTLVAGVCLCSRQNKVELCLSCNILKIFYKKYL